jgi:hypothetical protein
MRVLYDRLAEHGEAKATLVQRMAVAMEQGKLKVACDCTMADALAAEMRDFVGAINQRGNVTIEVAAAR